MILFNVTFDFVVFPHVTDFVRNPQLSRDVQTMLDRSDGFRPVTFCHDHVQERSCGHLGVDDLFPILAKELLSVEFSVRLYAYSLSDIRMGLA